MLIERLDQLEAIYGVPSAPAVKKELPGLIPEYVRLVEASPFVALATCGPEGLDCSPRGDARGFVRVQDPQTVILPDRRGNNRIDSLRNIVRDPRVALLFLIPGLGTTLRINGRAVISADPDVLESFEMEGRPPRTAIVITVETAYFQCSRAVLRSKLWDVSEHADPNSLPTPGELLSAVSHGELGGKSYDDEWKVRAPKSLW